MLEKTFESPLDWKGAQPVHPKGDQSLVFIGRTDSEAETPIFLATSCEELTQWKRLWYCEGLGAGEVGGDRGWDGWMASQTWWTWVWLNSRSWWWTGRPGVLRFMGWKELDTNERLNWTELRIIQQQYPAWGQFLLYENLLTNPVIRKYLLWDWVC